MLSSPLRVAALAALEPGKRNQADLLAATGSPARSTLRTQLNWLVELGAVAKRRRNRFPGMLEYELTRSGSDLLSVARALEAWLARAPTPCRALGETDARVAIKALTEGWSATIVRAVASGPRTLTDLDRLIRAHNYPALERRLGTMRTAGLLAARPACGSGTPYEASDWLRRSLAPLASAMRWEQLHAAAGTLPPGRLDLEAVFLLAAPLLRLPAGIGGSCRLTAEIPAAGGSRLAGAIVEVGPTHSPTCVTVLSGSTEASILGSTGAWLAALTTRDLDRLELGGNYALATAIVEALHRAFFSSSHEAGASPPADLRPQPRR
jgi:DNA-binding HxlR family transcriptional regulator